jgi:hypothetical protein
VVASAAFLQDQRDILLSLPTLPRLPLVPRSLFPEMTSTDSSVIFHDASGSFGVGGWLIDGDAFCYVSEAYPPEIQAAMRATPAVISISATELLATSMMVALARERRPWATYITSFTDNEAARVAATKGGSGSAAMAPVADRLARETADGGFLLRALRVSTKENAVADGLSRSPPLDPAAVATSLGLSTLRLHVPPRLWSDLSSLLT